MTVTDLFFWIYCPLLLIFWSVTGIYDQWTDPQWRRRARLEKSK